MATDRFTGVSTSEPSLHILGAEVIPIADLSITEANLHNEIDLEVSPTIVCGERKKERRRKRRELLKHFSHKHPLILCEQEDLSITEANLHNEVDLEVSPIPTFVGGEREADHRRELLHHFSHNHPLILCEKEEGKEEFCKGCFLSVVSHDPIYRCSSSASECCKWFLLHKSCAELPQEKIINSLHHEHSFKLFYYPSSWYRCNLCGEDVIGLRYSCPLCDLDLHITCASQLTFEPQGHEHSFILLKPTSFTCDGCGHTESEPCFSCLCTTCQLQVHTTCTVSCPLTVKIIRHSHKLTLTYSFQLDYNIFDKNCKICNRKLNSVFCVYYCAPCGYMAHTRCTTFEDFQDLYGIEENHTTVLMLGDPVETKEEIGHLDGEGTEQQLQVQHFSHPHCLILCNDEPKIDEVCDGCARPISVPFYTCADQCNFMLHKQCVELPNKIQHPLHRHTLTLQAKANLNIVGIFICDGCNLRCNGFVYSCWECNFFIDVGCSFFQNTLRHEGHQCDLSLVGGNPTKCSACGLDAFAKFICEKCNFDVDLKCASLPKTIRHKCPEYQWDVRPFNLTYYAVEDESGEYYCDICEERRGQNHWFYYCKDCDYYSHPQCILGEDLIKFGKIYRLYCHPHSLTLVKKLKCKGNPLCATCKSPYDGVPVLVCTECTFYVHYYNYCCSLKLE